MEKNSIRKEIANLIDSIKEHSEDIGNKKQIPQLELEVILQKIQKLYEKSIIYNHLNKLSNESELKESVPIAIVEKSKQAEPIQAKENPEKQVIMDLFASELPPPVPAARNKAATQKNLEVIKSSSNSLKKPIKDLKAAIGINEKFQFINELFNGNMQEYNIAVNQLDGLENYNEASTYVNSLQEIYRWKNEGPIVANFLNLIERRYL